MIIQEERYYFGDYEIYRKFVSGTLDTERTTVNVSDDKAKITTIDTQTVENSSLTIPALSLSNGNPTEVIRYQYSNHLGSASLELDDLAEIISYEEYHPFGTTSYRSGRTETETSQKRYKYVGKERNEETGLYYYGARYYAGWICRFVSVDPLQFNYPYYTPYQYAGNKPISFIDLDGLEEVKPEEDGSAQKQTELPKFSEDEFINKQIQFYFDEYGTNGDFSANVESEDGKFVKGSVTVNVGDGIVFTVDIMPQTTFDEGAQSEDGTILDANMQALERLGYSVDEKEKGGKQKSEEDKRKKYNNSVETYSETVVEDGIDFGGIFNNSIGGGNSNVIDPKADNYVEIFGETVSSNETTFGNTSKTKKTGGRIKRGPIEPKYHGGYKQSTTYESVSGEDSAIVIKHFSISAEKDTFNVYHVKSDKL